ncbi:MAG: hypothetical protein ACK2U9_01595, partial [Anaerolineae bacterium]
VRAMLSESLRAVISQTLLKKIGGGRVAAHEILIGTSAIKNLIRENLAEFEKTLNEREVEILNERIFTDEPATLQEMMLLVNRGLAALRLSMQPDGFNLGANLGKLAGAGIENHVHLHVVPRWGADTNFMTAVADTRTIPEALDQTYARLRAALTELETSSATG